MQTGCPCFFFWDTLCNIFIYVTVRPVTLCGGDDDDDYIMMTLLLLMTTMMMMLTTMMGGQVYSSFLSC